MKKLTDDEIIESVRRGNQNDYSLLIDRYKDRAFTLLRSILKNEMDAEEALQDSFLKVYHSLSGFRNDAKFSTWFYRIVYNTGLSCLTKKNRKIEKEMSSVEDHLELGQLDDNISFESEELKIHLMNFIERLPIRNALVIILFYIDDLSLNEISQVLNLSLVNTKVLLHRSRNVLREILIKQNYQEEFIW
ncbi:MAG: sigma-70 family RNA polymerase sigma factor [Bacteroidetes bacterium]|nr:sigma-70 family RNA polymerase sigma factor [Bacteroidota bacterium]MBU1678091.1 sigma-70 family RNA polymerase sigma factor [Bacteroidota bacterium]MBU2507107.1 sigma-70 family RNA polymerase sigma factor [Bacteroidota bacterium]